MSCSKNLYLCPEDQNRPHLSPVAAIQTRTKSAKTFLKVREVSVQMFISSTPRVKSPFMTRKLKRTSIPSQGQPALHPNLHFAPVMKACPVSERGQKVMTPEPRRSEAAGKWDRTHSAAGRLRATSLSTFLPSTPLSAYLGAEQEELEGEVPPLPWQRSKADVKTVQRSACGPLTRIWCEIYRSSHCFRGTVV